MHNDSTTTAKNRFENAPRAADFTIDQAWSTYSPEEHNRWDRLFERQKEVIRDRACSEVLEAMDALQLSAAGIPNMDRLSDRLEKRTGWRVVPVAGLVPDDIFFRTFGKPPFPGRGFHPA